MLPELSKIAFMAPIRFFSAFWTKSGQTLGMRAWRVKLEPLPGKRLTVARCALRCLGALLSAACLGLGYLWCLVDRRGRYPAGEAGALRRPHLRAFAVLINFSITSSG